MCPCVYLSAHKVLLFLDKKCVISSSSFCRNECKKKVILWLSFIFGFKHWYLLNNTYNTFHTDNAKLFGNIIARTHVCMRIPALSSLRRWIKPKYWVAKSLKPPSQKYLWWILFHEMPPWSSTHTNYCCKVNNSRKTWLVERIPWDVNWPPSQKVNADWGMHREKERVRDKGDKETKM